MGDMADLAREQEEAVEFERRMAAAERWRLAKEEDRRASFHEHKDRMAQIDQAADAERYLPEPDGDEAFGEVSETPRWFDARGVEVDLDDIDREYALNIYTHRLERGRSATDALSQKLREVILHGREPNMLDRLRGRAYNKAMQREGRRWRAPVDRP